MEIAKFVEGLAEKGRYHFTTEEAAKAVGSSYVAARSAIGRLRRKGTIAMPYRGFNVIVPPEYRRLGCLPPEQFVPQLMGHLGLDYYVGLLSAAEFHGAAHQHPQVFQVMLSSNRPGIRCGDVRVQFAARHNIGEMPTIKTSTPRGYVEISSVEVTAFDIVGYVKRCGGLNNTATVLAELVEKLKADKLARLAQLSPVPWVQRLGYLIEIVDGEKVAEPLADYVTRVAKEYVLLNPMGEKKDDERSARWKLIINDDVEAEA